MARFVEAGNIKIPAIGFGTFRLKKSAGKLQITIFSKILFRGILRVMQPNKGRQL